MGRPCQGFIHFQELLQGNVNRINKRKEKKQETNIKYRVNIGELSMRVTQLHSS
jgi:hypothetical protein